MILKLENKLSVHLNFIRLIILRLNIRFRLLHNGHLIKNRFKFKFRVLIYDFLKIKLVIANSNVNAFQLAELHINMPFHLFSKTLSFELYIQCHFNLSA